ncbi:MAG: neprosin family protein [Gemmataceae bacterium]|nr:neprosin family protein [Gemmataceae bacterium]
MPDFVAFQDFLERTASAKLSQVKETLERGVARVLGAAAARLTGRRRTASQVSPRTEFTKIKEFILDLYKGVSSDHTFLDRSGNHIDCIPIEQQATFRAARAARHKVRDKPLKPTTKRKRTRATGKTFGPQTTTLTAPLRRGLKDLFGNDIACPEGCVPIRRVTLSRLAHLGKFESYFQKGQVVMPVEGEAVPAGEAVGPDGRIHRHALAMGQRGAYFGCAAYLNVWDRSPSPGEMNLGQIWAIRERGAQGVQTVEAGWQIQPRFWGTDAPVLFVYFNPDNYGPRAGYVTNAKRFGFIQTSSNWIIGSDLPASTMDGQQLGFRMQWERQENGDWVFYLGGDNPEDVPEEIGYFPGFLYQDGDDFDFNRVDFGGEVATFPTSTASGPMGSGLVPVVPLEDSFRRVAFIRGLLVQTSGGAAWEPPAVQAVNRHAPNYQVAIDESDSWGTYLFFGGGGAV